MLYNPKGGRRVPNDENMGPYQHNDRRQNGDKTGMDMTIEEETDLLKKMHK